MADVEALNPQRRTGQVESVLELLQRQAGGREVPARATLCRTSDCSALTPAVSINARLSPRLGTLRSTWRRAAAEATPMCTGSGGRTGTRTSRATPSGDSPP